MTSNPGPYTPGDPDWAIRAQAFRAIERLALEQGGRIPWKLLERGFEFQGERVCFASRALGIFKPRQMSAALSVKTVVPRAGRKIRYQDQEIDIDVDGATGLRFYNLADSSLDSGANEFLRLAYQRQAPLVYFLGRGSAIYEAIWPVWVEHFCAEERRVRLAAADVSRSGISSMDAVSLGEPEIRDASDTQVLSTRRNHQAWFSSVIKSAYGYRCAFSGLPLRNLLVGAHIVPHAEGGPATVTNGICMSALHHSAFDSFLLGVDSDYQIHVARRVLEERDGPVLKSLQGLAGEQLRLPIDPRERPDPERLQQRFDQFRQAAGI